MSPKFEALLNYFNSLSVAESSAPETDKPLQTTNLVKQVFNWTIFSNPCGKTGASSTGNAPPIEDLAEELSDIESIKSNKAILRFNPKRFHNHEFKPYMFHQFTVTKPKSVGSEGPVPLSPKDLRDNSSVTIVTPAIIYAVKVMVGIKVRTDESRASINWKKEMLQAFSVCSSKQFAREFLESLNEEPDVLDKFEKVLPELQQELPDQPADQQQEDANIEQLYDNFLYSPNMNADIDTASEMECHYYNYEVPLEPESKIGELALTDSEPEVEPKPETETEMEAEVEQGLAPEQELEQKEQEEQKEEEEEQKKEEEEQEEEQQEEQQQLQLDPAPAPEPEQEQRDSLLDENTPIQSMLTYEDEYGIPEKTSPVNNKSESETLVSQVPAPAPEPVPEPVPSPDALPNELPDTAPDSDSAPAPPPFPCTDKPWYPQPNEDIYTEMFGANESEAIRKERGRRLGIHLEYVLEMKYRIADSINYTGDIDEMDPTPFPALRHVITSLTIDTLRQISPPPDYIVPYLRRPVLEISPEDFNELFYSFEPPATEVVCQKPEVFQETESYQQSEVCQQSEQQPRIDIDEREEIIQAQQREIFQKGVQKGRFIRALFKEHTSSKNPFRRLKAKYKKLIEDFKGLSLEEDRSDDYRAYSSEMEKIFDQTGVNMFIDESLIDAEVEKRWNAKHKHWYKKKASHLKEKAIRKHKERKLAKEKRQQDKKWKKLMEKVNKHNIEMRKRREREDALEGPPRVW